MDDAQTTAAKTCTTAAKSLVTALGGNPEAGLPVPFGAMDALTYQLATLAVVLENAATLAEGP